MTTDSGRVSRSTADGIGTLEFYHPAKNSLPGALLAEIASGVEAWSGDPEVRVIVLRSRGSGPFCAGASFAELTAIDSPEAGRDFFLGFARVICALRNSPRFVIGRIQGKAVGGGVGLAAACDYAVATEDASIKLSELALGLGPFVVGPAVERRIGRSRFAALSIDTGWRSARWAHQAGLYSILCPDLETLDQQVDRLAHRLADSNPEAMRELKQVLWEGTGHWERLLAERAEVSGRLVLSEFTTKAIQAFHNDSKRK